MRVNYGVELHFRINVSLVLVKGGEDQLLYNVRTSNSPLPNFDELY